MELCPADATYFRKCKASTRDVHGKLLTPSMNRVVGTKVCRFFPE